MSTTKKNSDKATALDAAKDRAAKAKQADAIRAIQAQDRDGVLEVLRNALEQAAKTGATGILLVLANDSSVASWTRTARTSQDVGLRVLGMSQVAQNQLMGLCLARPPVPTVAAVAPSPAEG